MPLLCKYMGIEDNVHVVHTYDVETDQIVYIKKYKTLDQSNLQHENGVLHCETGPAVTVFYHHVTPQFLALEEYYIDGVLHRDNDLPARVRSNEYSVCKEWFQHGKIHRVNNPASLHLEAGKDGKITVFREEWLQNGILHRIDGPAWSVHRDKKRTKCAYFVNGELIPKRLFLKTYLPDEYREFIANQTFVYDFKKYKVSAHIGKQLILEEIG